MHPSLALLLTTAIVLANAFFVAAEFAFVKIRPTRLQQLAREGRRRAKLLIRITSQLPAYLSASQLGITLASLMLGWLGEPAFAALLRPWLYRAGVISERTLHTLAATVSLIVITFLHTVLGELAPKALAIQRTEPIALWAVVPFRAFYMLTFPLTWTLKGAAALVLKILRLPPVSEAEMLHSPEELRLVLQHVQLDPGARRLIDRVFDYTHRLARHVMTLRRDVVTLEAGRPFEDNLRIAVANQYTRYPLIEPVTDRVVGYVHLKDIVTALASDKRPSGCASSCANRSTPRRTRASSGCGASSSAGACTSPSSSAPATASPASSRWRTSSRRWWARFKTSRTPRRSRPFGATPTEASTSTAASRSTWRRAISGSCSPRWRRRSRRSAASSSRSSPSCRSRATRSRPWAFTSPCSTCAIGASAACMPCRFPPRSPRSQKVDALYFW